MSLHPIRILDHVLEEYRDYLLTEFRAKDANLRAALERELDAPGFLAQELFFQAHRPFKSGKAWRELPIDARLATVMEQRSDTKNAYLHQSEAIDELLSPNPRPGRRYYGNKQRKDRGIPVASHPECVRGLGAVQKARTDRDSRLPHERLGQ